MDREPVGARSSVLAALVRERREAILARWEQAVRAIPRKSALSTPALRDHIPKILDSVAAAIEHGSQPSKDATDDHVVERLIQGVDLGELMAEYAALRASVIEECGEVSAPTASETLTFNRVLDAAMMDAAKRAVRSRDEIVAIVLHDLRNPLGAVTLGTDRILRWAEKEGVETIRVTAEAARSAARRMARITGDLQDSASIEAGSLRIERRPVDVVRLLDAAVASNGPIAAARSVQLELEGLPEGPITVECDSDRMLQVLGNLFANAIKFSPEGGRVTVGLTVAGAEVVVQVRDEGPGIPKEDVRFVFDRFWQGKPRQSGRGLGLAIARGIVLAHGGRIWVESVPDDGSTFFVSLPTASG